MGGLDLPASRAVDSWALTRALDDEVVLQSKSSLSMLNGRKKERRLGGRRGLIMEDISRYWVLIRPLWEYFERVANLECIINPFRKRLANGILFWRCSVVRRMNCPTCKYI